MELDTIICGDNVEVMRGFPNDSIDLVVTSPPYDNLRTYGGHDWDFESVALELWRVIKPGGVVVWVVNDQTNNGSETGTSFRQALRFMEIGFCIETMIYEKLNTGGARGSNRLYWQSFEFCFVLSKGRIETFNPIEDRANKYDSSFNNGGGKRKVDGSTVGSRTIVAKEFGKRNNIWKISNIPPDGASHPAPFPEALARDHILSWSNEGDIVLDPFSGSGTTAKMAKLNGRHWIGIEVNSEYVEIANKRLAQGVLF